jgi:hypothetical protein
MKNLVIVFMTLLSVASFGQENRIKRDEHRKDAHLKMSNLSTEQMAELATKKMALHLDLNESQQIAINEIELERAKKRKERHEAKENRKDYTEAERFEQKTEMLDAQIAHKKKIKSILTAEQYKKWESGRHSKKASRHGRRKNSTPQ